MNVANNIFQDIEDAVMERPYGFDVNDKRFYLYPATLGKSLLVSRLTQSLDLDAEIMAGNSCLEIMRAVKEQRDIACRIIAYSTANGKQEVFNAAEIARRQQFFAASLTDDEATQLLLVIYQSDKAAAIIKSLGLDVEQKEQARITKLKNKGGNTLMFGGKSIYGSLIGVACEKFGWTLDYVVWGISLVNLRLMLADAVNSIYLTEEERKSFKVKAGQEIINMDDPLNWDKIKSMKWE